MRKLVILQDAIERHEATLGKALGGYLGKLAAGYKMVWGDPDENGNYQESKSYQVSKDDESGCEKNYWRWVYEQFQDKHVLTASPLTLLQFAKQNQKELEKLGQRRNEIKKVSQALFSFDALRALKVLRPADETKDEDCRRINDRHVKIRWSEAEKYVEKWGGWNLAEFVRLLDVRYCPYCNAETVGIISSSAKRDKASFSAIDHVLPKGDYPLLALSLYNLVPACYRCNSQFKGAKDRFDLEHWNPNDPFWALHPYVHDVHKWFRFNYRPTSVEHLFLRPKDEDSPLSASLRIPLEKDCRKWLKRENYFERIRHQLDDYHLLTAYRDLYLTEINEILEMEMICTPTFVKTMKDWYTGMRDEDFDVVFRRASLDPREINKHRFAKLIIDLNRQIGYDGLAASGSRSTQQA